MDFNLKNVILVLACLAISLGGAWLFIVYIPQPSRALQLVSAPILLLISLLPLLLTNEVQDWLRKRKK